MRDKNQSNSASAMRVMLGCAALGVALTAHAQTGSDASLPSADQILDKYQQFLGGADALAKVTTREVYTRRLEFIDQPADELLVRESKRPGLSIMYHQSLDGVFLRYTNGCDAKSGWMGYAKPNDDGVPASGKGPTDGVCEQELYYYGYLPLDLTRLKHDVPRFEVKTKVKIVPTDAGSAGALAGGRGHDLIPAGPRETYLVLSTPLNSADSYVWLYFDTQTGALLRRADAGHGPTPVPAGNNPRYTDFIQYRDVGDGTRAPFQFVSIAANSETRGVQVDINDNKPVDDSVFVRPRDVRRKDKGL